MHVLNNKCYVFHPLAEQWSRLRVRVNVPERKKRSSLFAQSERVGALNNNRRKAKISIFPNSVGRDTKTFLPKLLPAAEV